LTTHVHTSPADLPVRDIARLMSARGIGAVVVTDGDKPIGIITDRDVVVRVIAPGLDPAKVMVGSAMSTPLVKASEHDSPARAVEIMSRYGIRRLPIVNSAGQLTTIMTLDDLLSLNLATTDALSQIVKQQRPKTPGAGVAPAPVEPYHDEAPAPAVVDQPVMQAKTVAAVVPSTVIVPMVRRRQRRTRLQMIRYWIEMNKRFMLVMVILSLLGVMGALLADYYGRHMYGTGLPSYYEPKDEERQLYLERQRAKQQNR
jgi:predicted transcriptional regulator